MENKESVVIVFADGPNEVVVPVTAYLNLETAITELSKILGEPARKTDNQIIWRVNEDDESLNTLFKGVYFGCGGPSVIVARLINPGEFTFKYSLD